MASQDAGAGTSSLEGKFENIADINNLQDSLKEEHVRYIESHPEIKEILSDFLAKVLLEKPEDVNQFAASYFEPFLPPPGKSDEIVPLVICGPSGAGKGTLIKKVFDAFDGKFGFSVSHTTRGPREGEEDGVHYHFVEKEALEAKIEAGDMLEYAHVHTNIYGTSWEAVDNVAATGKVCVLDIDIQGVKSVKESKMTPHYVYVAPPSKEVLEERLRGRGTETEEAISKRLENATGEMDYLSAPGNVDFTVVNDDLEEAFAKLAAQLRAWYPTHLAADVEGKEENEGKENEEEKKED